MKALTFSIVAGSLACNARCPFCVAGMTPANGIGSKEPEVDWRNFRKAAQFARDRDCSIAKITSKGEPTIFPDQITRFLKALAPFNFPIVEIQSNGILLSQPEKMSDALLKEWYELGLTTVAISVVHYDREKNRRIYLPHKKDYIDLSALIARLKKFRFLVRLTSVLCTGYLDSTAELEKMLAFCRANKVDQFTILPVTKPDESEDQTIYQWTKEHAVTEAFIAEVETYLNDNGTALMSFAHGGQIFDVKGQNVCFTNCLTAPSEAEFRHLIFYPDGALRYDWRYSSTRIL